MAARDVTLGRKEIFQKPCGKPQLLTIGVLCEAQLPASLPSLALMASRSRWSWALGYFWAYGGQVTSDSKG